MNLSKLKQSITISLRGIGCNIIKGSVDIDSWQSMIQISHNLGVPIENAIFDSEFFPILNIPAYRSWCDFNNIYKISGLLYDNQDFIELRINKKQKLKVYFRDIWKEILLFPLYDIEITDLYNERIEDKSIVLVET